ncbi:MAG: M20/M25/M40 family metallo-hydrolase [Nitrospiria bacterium]
MANSPNATFTPDIDNTDIIRHIRALEGERHPETAPNALEKAADYLFSKMKSFDLKVQKASIQRSSHHNVVASLPSRQAENGASGEGVLVIGAHLDTVEKSPGADDNASGLAVLLEVARSLAPFTGNHPVEFVAFTLEETGFIGSEAYLQDAEKKGIPIWGAIILECVGYTSVRPGSQETPPGLPFDLPGRGDFIGVVGNSTSEPMQKCFELSAKSERPMLPSIRLSVPGRGEGIPDTRRSDHVPFWDRDLPAIMLTDTANFRNPHYHRTSDRLLTLDVPFITSVARALAKTVFNLAGLR